MDKNTAKRQRNKSSTSVGATKTAILNTAERVFATQGLLEVSLRQVAREAGVDPASITYHYGSKEDVLAATIARRYEMLRGRRISALNDALSRTKNKPSARDVLDAMFRPWLEYSLSEDPGWRHYSKLIAGMMTTPRITEIIEDLAGVWEHTQINALRLAHPEANDEQIMRALTLTLGTSFFFFSETKRIDVMSSGRFRADDLNRGYPQFLDFVSAGFEAAVKSELGE